MADIYNSNPSFENGTYDNYRFSDGSHPSAIQEIVSSPSPVRFGTYALHLQASDHYRNELIPEELSPPHPSLFYWNTEYWLGTSIYLKDYNTDPDKWTTIVQSHSVPSLNPDGTTNWNCCSGDNGWTLRTGYDTVGSPNKLGFHARIIENPMTAVPTCSATGPLAWEIPCPENQWIDMVVNFILSTGNNGLIKMWMNDVLEVDISGPNIHHLDVCGLPRKQVHTLQMGIYKDRSLFKTRDMYLDELRFAGADASYSDVAPGGGQEEPLVINRCGGVHHLINM